ncbi:Potassium transporter [Apiospora marii]|uniref:Potassium transporter n=1 Tax=Apiospora marii TaxID=335849 RepID=A0ABR1R098_9PEZI
MAEYAKFSSVNPQWENFVQSEPDLQNFRSRGGDADEQNAVILKIQNKGPQLRRIPQDSEIETRDFYVSARDRHQLLVRSYHPKDQGGFTKSRPLFIYYHGGGWLTGNIETGDDNCRLISGGCDICVLNVDYRLAPEHIFPTSINDAYDVFRWAAQNAQTALNVDLRRGFIVGGVSAGSNMAAAIAYLARDDGIAPPITGLWLSVPCCLSPRAFDLVPQWKDKLLSIEQNRNADLLNVPVYEQLLHGMAYLETNLSQSRLFLLLFSFNLTDLYTTDILKAPVDDTRLSFLLNSDHSHLPTRAYFQIGGLDPLRDESLLFARLLQEQADCRTLIHMYDGLPHGFWRFQQLQVSQEWDKDALEGTRFLLGGGDDGLVVKGR